MHDLNDTTYRLTVPTDIPNDEARLLQQRLRELNQDWTHSLTEEGAVKSVMQYTPRPRKNFNQLRERLQERLRQSGKLVPVEVPADHSPAMGQETVSEGDIQGILDNEEPGLTDLFGVYEAAEASYFAAANASVPTSVTTASTTPLKPKPLPAGGYRVSTLAMGISRADPARGCEPSGQSTRRRQGRR